MFTEGIHAILTEVKYPPIKIVGLAYSLEELKKMLAFPIDLLIFELAMIENEGFVFMSELKKAIPNIRIIVLSNYGEPNMVRDAFMHGADGYVLKSNNSIELIQCIDRVLEGKTFLAEGLRLSPEFVKQKKSPNLEKKKKIYEDRFLLKQKLTKREKQILSLIVQFKNNKVIAQELFISDQTVSVHRKRIMKKFGVNNTVNLIIFSLDHQLV
jgi:DNA-binding NarL/FixJ family response regulator